MDLPSFPQLPAWLKTALVVVLGLWLAALGLDRAFQAGISWKNLNHWQNPSSTNDTIAVTAEGKVTAIPDIGLVNLSVENRGGTVAEVLARLGVGRLTLVDGDRFEDSNLNRQLLSTVEGLGQLKSEAAQARVGRINPSVDVNALAEFVTADNAGAVLEGCNVVVDCLDNLRTRFVVEDACRRIGCPLVSAAVAGASGHVTTIFPEDTGLRLIYGEPGQLPLKGAETALGTLPHTVVFLATLECAEVVKVILKKGSLLRHKLLVADLMDGIVEVMNLR